MACALVPERLVTIRTACALIAGQLPAKRAASVQLPHLGMARTTSAAPLGSGEGPKIGLIDVAQKDGYRWAQQALDGRLSGQAKHGSGRRA